MKGPLFKWFGSKWMASKHYPKPQCDLIVEPFAGSAGYASRHANRPVIICENNPLLIELWEWIIGAATTDNVLDIPLDLPEGTDIQSIGLTRGQQLLLKHWQRTNNYGNCWTTSPWGSKPGQWTRSTRERVSREIHEVKHWKFIRSSEFDPMAVPVGTWLIDPPYEYNYKYGQPNFDSQSVVKMIEHIHPNSQIIACEARCPKTGSAPSYLPFVDFKDCVTSRRSAAAGNHTHSREMLWTRDAI
jgi:hypothetical protein